MMMVLFFFSFFDLLEDVGATDGTIVGAAEALEVVRGLQDPEPMREFPERTTRRKFLPSSSSLVKKPTSPSPPTVGPPQGWGLQG